MYEWSNSCLKDAINQINPILPTLQNSNMAARCAKNIYSVRYKNICISGTFKQDIHKFFEVFRILVNPQKVDYTKRIREKCKLRSRDCLQQHECWDVLAQKFVFWRARRNNRVIAVCCRCVFVISSDHIAAGRQSSTHVVCCERSRERSLHFTWISFVKSTLE